MNKVSDNVEWEKDFEFVKNDIEFYNNVNHRMNPEDIYTDLNNVFSFICRTQTAVEYFEMWHYSCDFFSYFNHPQVNHLYTFVISDNSKKEDFWMDFTEVYPKLKNVYKDIVKHETI